MRWWFIVILCLLLQISQQADKTKNVSKSEEKKVVRGYRQTSPKPSPRPSFFSLLRGLVGETIADANRAAANISAIISENFPSVSGSTQTPMNATEGEEVLSFQNVTDILGKNFRSLRRLFNRELSNAIRDSRKNIERYRKEFRNAILPYFTPDNSTNTTTSKPIR